MSEASEQMEHAEHLSHAAHKGHGGHAAPDPVNRFIGLTMALLGVILALCAAQVGGSRTELIKTMVEQSAAHTKYQAQAIKYRLTVSQLEGLRSMLVTAKDADEAEDSIKKLTTDDSGATGATLQALAVSTRRVIEAGSPHRQDMLRFVGLARKYRAERDAGQDWTESYSTAISGYALAAEHYELAQLAAEIGIILASIALLLSNRKLWGVSLLVGVVCIGTIAWTYQTTHPLIAAAKDEIEHKEKAYRDLRKAQDEKANDEKLLQDIEDALGKADKPNYAQSSLHGS